MPTQGRNEKSVEKLLDRSLAAILAEYNAIRDASLSRDSVRGSLAYLMIILLSAALIGTPGIIAGKEYVLLLAFSLVSSSIAVAYTTQSQLIAELAFYEAEVLRPQVQKLLSKKRGAREAPPLDLKVLWSWQSYIRTRLMRGSILSRLVRMNIDFSPLFVIASLGYMVLFILYRGIAELNWSDYVLLGLDLLGFGWLLLRLVQVGKAYQEDRDS